MKNLGSLAAWSHGHPVFTTLLVVIVFSGLFSGIVTVDPASMSSTLGVDGLPAQDALETIEDTWGAGQTAFIHVTAVDPASPETIRAVDQSQQEVAAIPGVFEVASLADPIRSMVGSIDTVGDEEIRSAISALPADVFGRFATEDSLLIRIMAEKEADPGSILEKLYLASAGLPGEAQPAGPMFTDLLLQENARGELRQIMPLSAGIIILLLVFFFRRPLDILAPLITVLVSLGMAVGLLAWSGLPMNEQSLLVLPLLLGLGVGYMFHVIYPLRDLDPRIPLEERFRCIWGREGRFITYAAITSVIAFGSFLFSPIPQIRSWGLLIGSGVAFSAILGSTLLPALYRFQRHSRRRHKLPLGGVMRRVAGLSVGRPKSVLIVGGIVTIALAGATVALEFESTLQFDLSDAPEQNAADAIAEEFGGQSIGQLLLAEPTLQELELLERQLLDMPQISFVDGPASRIDRLGGGPLQQPGTQDLVAPGYARILFGYTDSDSDAVIDHITSTAFDLGRAELTGQDVVVAQAQSVILRGMVASIGVSFLLVAILLAMIHRNITLATMTFVPLLIVIVWQLGMQALLGIPFNPVTGVTTAMILGIGVDFSLHTVSHYRAGRSGGRTRHLAAHDAIAGVGRPIVASTITAIGAFAVLAGSGFTPLKQFGSVALVSFLSAFVITMFILPAAIASGPRHRDGDFLPKSDGTSPGRPRRTMVEPRPVHGRLDHNGFEPDRPLRRGDLIHAGGTALLLAVAPCSGYHLIGLQTKDMIPRWRHPLGPWAPMASTTDREGLALVMADGRRIRYTLAHARLTRITVSRPKKALTGNGTSSALQGNIDVTNVGKKSPWTSP